VGGGIAKDIKHCCIMTNIWIIHSPQFLWSLNIYVHAKRQCMACI